MYNLLQKQFRVVPHEASLYKLLHFAGVHLHGLCLLQRLQGEIVLHLDVFRVLLQVQRAALVMFKVFQELGPLPET